MEKKKNVLVTTSIVIFLLPFCVILMKYMIFFFFFLPYGLSWVSMVLRDLKKSLDIKNYISMICPLWKINDGFISRPGILWCQEHLKKF